MNAKTREFLSGIAEAEENNFSSIGPSDFSGPDEWDELSEEEQSYVENVMIEAQEAMLRILRKG